MPEIYPQPIGFTDYSERIEQRLSLDELRYRDPTDPLEVVFELDSSGEAEAYRLFAEVHGVLKFDPALRYSSAVMSLDPHAEQSLAFRDHLDIDPTFQRYGVFMRAMNRMPLADEPFGVPFQHDFMAIKPNQEPLEINVEGRTIRAIGGYLLEADPDELEDLLYERDIELQDDTVPPVEKIAILTADEIAFMEDVHSESENVVGRHSTPGRYLRQSTGSAECL